MLKKRIGMMLKGVLMAGALSLSACAGSSAAGAGTVPFEPPAKGEELAVLHTNMGDIKLRLYPEEAPLAVENFITHAKDGYYDGVIFHRVLKDFMIQGGDPDGTGTGGESIFEGGGFGYEKSDKLRHYRGALAMAHSQLPDSNGSQFYIVQNSKLADEMAGPLNIWREDQDELISRDANGNDIYARDAFPPEVIDQYLESGGTPHLDLAFNPNGHTVFGNVVEGMDVVDAIADVAVDGQGKPAEDVIIENISFETVA